MKRSAFLSVEIVSVVRDDVIDDLNVDNLAFSTVRRLIENDPPVPDVCSERLDRPYSTPGCRFVEASGSPHLVHQAIELTPLRFAQRHRLELRHQRLRICHLARVEQGLRALQHRALAIRRRRLRREE